MDKLFLKKDIVLDKKISNEALLTYIAINSILIKNRTIDFISASRLAFAICGVSQNDYKKIILNSLSQGIQELAYLGHIKILKTINATDYIVDLSELVFDAQKEYFILADVDEIKTIISSINRIDNMLPILRYFLCMVGSFNNSDYMGDYKGKIGGLTIETLANNAGISTRSATRYNDKLVDLKLIYIYKSKDYICLDDSLKRFHNIYSRYCDRDLCKSFGMEKEAEYGHEQNVITRYQKTEQSNKNRKLAQQYNAICRGHDKYSQEEIQDIYDYVISENEKYNALYTTTKYKEYLNKLRDEDIFNKYDFLKLKEE